MASLILTAHTDSALTLFDTGAYTSFVNREVAKWLEQQDEDQYSYVQRISTATCRGSVPCTTCTDLSTIGYDNALCSISGRPFTPQQRVHKKHPIISTEDLIKKRDLLDPLDDDDDIEWKANPFDVDSLDGADETPEELMSKITFKGSPQLQTRLKALVLEFFFCLCHQSSSRTCSGGTNEDSHRQG